MQSLTQNWLSRWPQFARMRTGRTEESRGAAIRCTCQATGPKGNPREAKRVPRGRQKGAQGLPMNATKGPGETKKGSRTELITKRRVLETHVKTNEK